MDVPLLITPETPRARQIFPLYRNGEGYATEMLMINTDREHHDGGLRVLNSNGQAKEVILR